jgi:bifunctional non-homologous end joining protein LigD
MMAKAGPLPGSGQTDTWSYEMKWDGIRAVAYLEGSRVELVTRNDRNIAAGYPELTAAVPDAASSGLILDGEIVALDQAGRPSFERLQQRMHVVKPEAVRRLSAAVPVHYFAFDVLAIEQRSTLGLSYDDRRELLQSLEMEGPRWLVPPAFVGDGEAALAASRHQGLEGVVAKRRDSVYLPGTRSASWVKIKHVRTQEVVIGGWRPGQGRRKGGIGSLLVGIPGGNGLDYVGHVGTGFSDSALSDLSRQLGSEAVERSPFASELPPADARDAHWVSPILVGEVTYAEFTSAGRLRHPSWRGLRPDKSPSDVVREP